MPLFLHLVYLLREDSDGLSDGDSSKLLFAHFIEAFNFMVRESTDQAAEIILYEVKAQSLSYRRHVSWTEIPKGDGIDLGQRLLDVPSPEFLGMLQSLATNLTSFCQRLKPPLVAQVVERVSWLLSEFLLEEVILANDLSPAGIQRLQRDVRVGVRPILGQFGHAAPAHTTRLQEAMELLTAPAGSALLLMEALRETVDVAEARDILREHGVRQLSGSMAEAVLARRTDVADMRRDL